MFLPLSPDGMLAHAGCRVPISSPSTLFTALAHCLQDSLLLTYGDQQTPLVQFHAPNGHDQRAGAIENA
jgi:hypothetical protein